MLVKVEGKTIEVNEKLLIQIDKISGNTIKGEIVSHTTTPGLKMFQTVIIRKKDVKDVCVTTSP